MFAVVKIGAQQFKVREKDEVLVQKLDLKEGENIKINDVYLVAEDDASMIKLGMPYVGGAHVECQVMEQFRGEKLRVFKFHAKKRYQKTYGHRTHFTRLKVLKISAIEKKVAPIADASNEKAEKKSLVKKPAAKKKATVKTE